MKKLLHVAASPRGGDSHSGRVARKFVDAYTKTNPEDSAHTLDLWDLKMPHYDESAMRSRYAALRGEAARDDDSGFWPYVRQMFNAFNSADKYVFSVPMWNFGIPYKLKHYIDLITQPRMAFMATESGCEGLVRNKPAAVVYSSGGSYEEEPFKSMDFQKGHFEAWLRFIGFTDIRRIVVAPTMRREGVEKMEADALMQAEIMASMF